MSIELLRNLPEVNRVLNLRVSVGMSGLTEEDREKFKFLHFNRNYFNTDAVAVTSLTQQYHTGFYSDNHGKVWRVLPTIMNKYHMPESEYSLKSISGLTEAWSRKFVRWDNQLWGGEFELIVRGNGQVIEGDNKAFGNMLGTYNFGRTIQGLRHKKLDIEPHFDFSEDGKYVVYPQVKSVIAVNESKSLSELIFD